MQREDRGLTLTNYAIERFLYRLSNSQYANDFVLKGAQLFRVWGNNPYRPTRDLDLLGFGNPDVSRLEEVFRNICRIETDVQDGITYKAESVRGQAIREDNMYDGVRIKLEYRIGRTGEFMQIDIGFGDEVYPPEKQAAFPAILNMPAPKLRTYSYELAVAEKIEAMVTLGFANSRMKDFYDVYQLAGKFEFDGKLLAQAIQNTFRRRGTAIPEELPTSFTREFYEDKLKQSQWDALSQKIA
ncbi:nucleotidyl transferase AbiEii/AbiGii toxin family protein [Sedimentisphaera cyanobacteriorum]|nr:nucleotidyl transferase AbiEii/AbiGii toxin family protein [Sedimentisphaera cyanobacteriorum]